jgi:membrane peptidoglycan carboxypeptidase
VRGASTITMQLAKNLFLSREALYFGRRPEELNLPECFFLASIMPSPIRYGSCATKGEVSEGWMKHLQTPMESAAKNGKVTKAELAEGLAQPIVFIKPGDPPPEPRKPVSSGRRDPYEEDSGWQPLE